MSNEIVRYRDLHSEGPLARRGSSAIVKAINWILHRGEQRASEGDIIDAEYSVKETEQRGVPLVHGSGAGERAAETEEDSTRRYVRSESSAPLEFDPRHVYIGSPTHTFSFSGETHGYAQPTTPPRNNIGLRRRITSFPSAHPRCFAGLVAGLALATGYYFLRGDDSTLSKDAQAKYFLRGDDSTLSKDAQAKAGFGSGIDGLVDNDTNENNREKLVYSNRINLFDDVNHDGLPDDPKNRRNVSARYFESPDQNTLILEGVDGKYEFVDSEDKINIGVSDRSKLSDIEVESIAHGARFYDRRKVLSSGTAEERREFDRLQEKYRAVVTYISGKQ